MPGRRRTYQRVGSTKRNWSASTRRGLRFASISVSPCRTARCTVSAASYWSSLLSSVFNARLSPRLTVVGPGLPVAAAQHTTEGAMASPAPSRMPERSIDLRDMRRSNSDSGIVDLQVVGRAAARAAEAPPAVVTADTRTVANLRETRNSWRRLAYSAQNCHCDLDDIPVAPRPRPHFAAADRKGRR